MLSALGETALQPSLNSLPSDGPAGAEGHPWQVRKGDRPFRELPAILARGVVVAP